MTKDPMKAFLAGQQGRHAAEAARIDRVRARGIVPPSCGRDIAPAPARGVVATFLPREIQKTANGNFREVRNGYAGRLGLRRCDAFDVMQARSDARAKARGVDPRPLFSTAQIEAGRRYGALVQQLAGSGFGLSQMERSGGGRGGAGVNEAQIDMIDRLSRMRTAIGTGWAIGPEAVDPGRDRRRPIRLRSVVDAVCLDQATITAVLKAHLWPNAARTQRLVQKAFAEALDRLYPL